MMRKFLLIAALAALSASAFAAGAPQINKHAAKGVACATCHPGNRYGPVADTTCRKCHDTDKLAQKTARLNFESKMKNAKTGEVKSHTALVNPHDSYHFGKTEDCSDCHRNHRQSVNDCATCHDVEAWGMKPPK